MNVAIPKIQVAIIWLFLILAISVRAGEPNSCNSRVYVLQYGDDDHLQRSLKANLSNEIFAKGYSLKPKFYRIEHAGQYSLSNSLGPAAYKDSLVMILSSSGSYDRNCRVQLKLVRFQNSQVIIPEKSVFDETNENCLNLLTSSLEDSLREQVPYCRLL